jgi:aspartate aminotransferase-like enzyme
VHLVFQVTEALRMMHEEGLDAVYERHDAMAARVRDGIAALGLSLQSPSMIARSSTVTGVTLPAGIEPKAVRDELKRQAFSSRRAWALSSKPASASATGETSGWPT